jgi:ABC-2 type transport system ATP-binding protein
MISVTGLSKRYGSHLAVKDVSFNIEKGEVIGFLGPNGAGKSTIMNILTGYLSLTQGKVEIDGFDITENPEEAKKRIGYLPELPPLYMDMKVREYLDFVYDLKKVKFPKKSHINEILKLVKIDDVQNRLIKNLSKGYRQRVGFAQALIGNPDVLILDEPTVGLDPKQIIEIRNLIAKLGKNHTIILSSHILSEIQSVCKRVIIINQGEIIADDISENLSAKLSSDLSLVARIICSENEMLETLKTVKDVKSVVCLGCKENGSFDFLIEPEDNCDIRAAVFERVVSRGKTILSLTSNSASLEQVFLKLTEVADNDEARKMLGTENNYEEEN